jgi:hypothetical protein
MLSDDGKTAHLNDPKVVDAVATTAGIVQASGGWNRLKSLRDSFDFFGAKKHLPFTGLYSGNKVADEQIFGQIYKPADNPRFDDAVQTVLGVQDVAFATPPSPAGAEFQKAWQDGVNRVLTGQMEPARAMERAQREAQAALDKAAGG